MRGYSRHRKGFTLVELMVAMAVVIILATLVSVGIKDYLRMGRRGATQGTLTVVSLAVSRYSYLHGEMPTNLEILLEQSSGEKGALLNADDLKDVWLRKLSYAVVKENSQIIGYAVWSWGQDGKNNSGGAPQSFSGDDIGVFVRI